MTMEVSFNGIRVAVGSKILVEYAGKIRESEVVQCAPSFVRVQEKSGGFRCYGLEKIESLEKVG
jgi:hypothetical protein